MMNIEEKLQVIMHDFSFEQADSTYIKDILKLASISHKDKKEQVERYDKLYKQLTKTLANSENLASQQIDSQINYNELNLCLKKRINEIDKEIYKLGIFKITPADGEKYISDGGNEETLNKAKRWESKIKYSNGTCILRLKNDFSLKQQHIKEIIDLACFWIYKKGRIPLTNPDLSGNKNNQNRYTFFHLLSISLNITPAAAFQKWRDVFEFEWRE